MFFKQCETNRKNLNFSEYQFRFVSWEQLIMNTKERIERLEYNEKVKDTFLIVIAIIILISIGVMLLI